MASAKAVDGCFGDEVAPLAHKLRDMYYNAHYIHSHIAHFYALAAPDFVCGPDADPAIRNILGVVAKVGLEIGGAGHPRRAAWPRRSSGSSAGATPRTSGACPAAWPRASSRRSSSRSSRWVDELYDFAQFSLQLFRDVVLGNPAYVDLIVNGPYTLDVHNMGLVDENNAPNFYDGKVRVVDFEGKEICKYEPDEYADYVAEHVEPWTYLKFPYLKKRGWKGFVEGIDSSIYCATPLARLNVADRMATPQGPGGLRGDVRDPRRPPLQGAAGPALGAARRDGPERRDAAALLRRSGDHRRRSSASSRSAITGEGVGIVEAMRGTLTHHYTCDENGICTSANLIVGTTNNNAPIQMVTKEGRPDADQAGSGARPGHPQHDRDGLPRLRPLLQLRHAQPARADAARGCACAAAAR